MIIIYGRRSYGRVDEWGGEYAQTSFLHVYYMPLIPNESFWVTRSAGGTNHGLPLRLNLKSVAAAYLRTWAPLVAVIALVADPGIVSALVAVALGALALTSLSWRSVGNAETRRRSDFNLLAFGTRCEPALVTTAVRTTWRASLDERWATLDAKRPPDDVARFGAASLNEAVVAYGLLRLAALEKRGGAEGAAADRLLAGSHELPPEGDGPYRGGDPSADRAPVFHDEAAAVAAKYTAARTSAVTPRSLPWWNRRGSKALTVAILAAISIGGLVSNRVAFVGPTPVAAADLNRTMIGDDVSMTCDDISDVGEIVDAEQHATDHVSVCTSGGHTLLLRTPPDALAAGTQVQGTLHTSYDLAITLPAEVAQADVLRMYLDVHDATLARAQAGLAGIVGLLAVALAVFWIMRARRRRTVTAV